MDVIRLKENHCLPRLGVGELEKEWVQKVDPGRRAPSGSVAAARADDLRRTTDYQRVYETVREICETGKHHLIEALALRIGETRARAFLKSNGSW